MSQPQPEQEQDFIVYERWHLDPMTGKKIVTRECTIDGTTYRQSVPCEHEAAEEMANESSAITAAK